MTEGDGSQAVPELLKIHKVSQALGIPPRVLSSEEVTYLNSRIGSVERMLQGNFNRPAAEFGNILTQELAEQVAEVVGTLSSETSIEQLVNWRLNPAANPEWTSLMIYFRPKERREMSGVLMAIARLRLLRTARTTAFSRG